MTRWLVILVVLVVAVGAALFWLSGYAEQNSPYPDHQVIEVDLDV